MPVTVRQPYMRLSMVLGCRTWGGGDSPSMNCVHSLEKLFSAVTIPMTFDLKASLIPSAILRAPE